VALARAEHCAPDVAIAFRAPAEVAAFFLSMVVRAGSLERLLVRQRPAARVC
jgi:hypothetical protein